MRFTKLIIENYKSFQLRTEIDFTIGRNEPRRNVFLIGALNGSGKTSVLEAINICLYGEKKNKIFEAINGNQKTTSNFSCSFELHIKTNEDEIVTVRRHWWVPPATKNPEPKDLRDELTVSRNGEPYSNQQMGQEHLEANFPRGITQFFFFDGEKIQMLANDAALGVKDDMEAALGITPVRQLIKDLEYLRREENPNQQDSIEVEIENKEKEISKLYRKRNEFKNEEKETDEDIRRFNETLEGKNQIILHKYKVDPEKNEEIRRLKNQTSELSNRLLEVESQSRDWAESWLPLALLSEYFPALRQQIDAERQVRKQTQFQDRAESLADIVAKEVRQFELEERQKPLTQEEFQAMRERIFKVVREFVPDDSEIKSIQELLKLSDANTAKIEWRIENLERKTSHQFEKIIIERQWLKQQLDPLQRELEGTPGEEEAGDHLQKLLKEYHDYSFQLGRKKEKLKQVRGNLEEVDKDIAKCEREKKELHKKCQESQKQHKFLNQINNLIKLFTEYIDRLRESKIGQLKEYTLLMYQEIYRKGELISDIEIDPVSYFITIRDHYGSEVQKQNLSAGEKEVFAISLLWGLAETSQLSLPIVIDTPLSRLDSIHKKNIVNKYYPEAGNQVIVLSTDQEVDENYYKELEPFLQHAITLDFDKENERTILKDGYFSW